MRHLDKELSNSAAIALKTLRGLTLATVLTLVLCVALAIAGIYAATTIDSDIPISGSGKTAMIIGITATLLVGVALMSLIFFSSRRGFDDSSRPDANNDQSR